MEHKCETCDHLVCDTDNYKELKVDLKLRTNEKGETFLICPGCADEIKVAERTLPDGMKQIVILNRELEK